MGWALISTKGGSWPSLYLIFFNELLLWQLVQFVFVVTTLGVTAAFWRVKFLAQQVLNLVRGRHHLILVKIVWCRQHLRALVCLIFLQPILSCFVASSDASFSFVLSLAME